MAVPAHKRSFYVQYMRSDRWRDRRQRRIETAGRRCEHVDKTFDGLYEVRCPRQKYLTVHHRHYGTLGDEADDDLEVLCWGHHMAHHLMSRRCRTCNQPVFDTIEDALDHVLSLAGDIEEHDHHNWKDLPSQEELFISSPPVCAFCEEVHGRR